MEIVPNGVCSPRDTYYMDCTAETYCSHTVLQDHFVEPDQDILTFESTTTLPVSWLKYSMLNATFHGYATSELTEPIHANIRAMDPFGGECSMTVVIEVKEATSEKWPYFVGIILAILLALFLIFLFIHCVFIGSKWGDIVGRFFFRKRQAQRI